MPIRQHSLQERLRNSWRIVAKEVASFGAVGLVGLIVDLGLFHIFLEYGRLHTAAISVYTSSKVISTTVATIVTYLGNRYFSFSHRARSSLRREAGFFVLINAIVLIIGLIVLFIFTHPLGFDAPTSHDHAVIQIVNLGTIGIGTLFRFWAYKRFVFLHPDRTHSPDVDLDEELTE